MTIAQQLETEGRRRAETGGQDTVGRAPGAVATAFAELNDRHQLVTHNLDTLEARVDDLAARLAPVLPESGIPGVPVDPTPESVPGPVDDRGMVSRSLSSEARQAQGHAARVATLHDRLVRLLDVLEV